MPNEVIEHLNATAKKLGGTAIAPTDLGEENEDSDEEDEMALNEDPRSLRPVDMLPEEETPDALREPIVEVQNEAVPQVNQQIDEQERKSEKRFPWSPAFKHYRQEQFHLTRGRQHHRL